MAEETIAKSPVQQPEVEQTRSGYSYRPSVDILEKGEELLVLADMPGADPAEIHIDFERGELTIHARVEPRHADVPFLVQEYGVGDYYCTFRVAETIDASRITADYTDGVLTLRLPKAEAARPRKISVQA